MESEDMAMLVYAAALILTLVYAAALILTFFLSLPTFVLLAWPGAVYVSFKVINLFLRVQSMIKAGLLLLKLVFITGLCAFSFIYLFLL